MRKPIRALCASLIISSLVVGTAFAAPSSAELDQKKNTLEQQKSAKEKEVSQYQSQYTSLVNKIDELETNIIATGEEVTKAQQDLEAAQKKADEQNEEMRMRIKYLYESGGDMGMLSTFLESDNFAEMVTKAEYSQNVHQYDRDKLDEYKETTENVKKIKESLDQKMSDLESQQDEFQAKKDQVNTLLEKAQSDVSSLNADIQTAIQQAEAARAEEAKAAAEAERQRQAAAQEQQRQQQQANVSTPTQGGGGSTGGGYTDSGSSGSSVSQPSYQGQGNTAVAQAIVSAAYSQLGVPYVWGGTSPGVGLDCSGLTGYAHRVAGISIPRTSGAQLAGGQIVSDPQPGDICWTPGHVAIYIGGGQMIEAPQPGDVVKISAVRVSSYVRYW